MAQDIENFLGNGFIHVNERDGHPSHFFSSQLEPCDIDSFFSQKGAYGADHAGDILIMKDENVALGDRLEIEVVDPDNSRVVAPKDRAFDLGLFVFGLDSYRDGTGKIAGTAAFLLYDIDTSLSRHHRGVDVVHTGLHHRC